MSREVLLTLLGTLLVVNVGVLISIGLFSRRGRARQTTAAELPARVDTSASLDASAGPEVGMASEAFSRAADLPPSRKDPEAAVPDAEAAVVSMGHPPPPGRAESGVFAAPVASPEAGGLAVRAQAPDVSSVGVAVIAPALEEDVIANNGHVEHDVDALNTALRSNEVGAQPGSIEKAAVEMSRNDATSTTAGGKRRRSRRFVLPPLEEDGDRSARAIESFLGDASTSPPVAYPERSHRRRHRARRAHGTKTTRTSLVVELVGYEELAAQAGAGQAARLVGAVVEALWRNARIGDEVRELAPGQIQLVLDCDPAGADAFAERAAATVAPWLRAMPAAVQVRIAQAPIESPSAISGSITARR